ncbi:TNF receptor-associated factor 6 [Madurella mycetomatis]|uniref:TNF receptor-associated factor 6 n=1 Tax=Madurella mycetomatis TaxID=100816 RepID=A0A175W0F6_9PEZI|nr:TNF receptor-associated factor 6 [Madurella mycetomatis]
MPPPNTPEEGVTAPTSRPTSPIPYRQASPQPSSAIACASRGDSALEIDYQSLEYIGPVDDTLLCPVCRTPFHAPITTPCGHTFCAGCINRALEMQPTCPIDRQPINKTRDYRRLPLIIKDQLDRLKVKCPNTGCDHECSREHIEGHYERRCEFTLVRCPDAQCSKRIARRDALAEKGCMHRDVSCQYCDEAVTVVELDTHYDRSCSGATASCTECGATMVRHRLEKHKSQDCPEGQTRCKWHTAGCRVAEKRRAVWEHERSGCMFEAIGRLLQERAEDRKVIDDLVGRLAGVEIRTRRREQRRERRPETSPQQLGPALPGDMTIPDSSPTAATELRPIEVPAVFLGENRVWGSPEDYMLAQFERMDTQIEDLRKKMLEMDANQSLMLLQTNARLNEQLAELASKVGVLNMHTTWLMNMQRQNHTQQRATTTAGPVNPGMSRSGDAGATRESPENPIRYNGSGRRNSDGRGENPPRL